MEGLVEYGRRVARRLWFFLLDGSPQGENTTVVLHLVLTLGLRRWEA